MQKLIKKQQKIKQLLQSLPDSHNNLRKIHFIDRKYRHHQINQLPSTQLFILNKTLNTLIENQQQRIEQSLQLQNAAYCGQAQRKLQNYVYSKTPSKSLDLNSSPSNKKHMNLQNLIREDRVYIERKFNCKLSYELHNILQATTIEQQSAKIKRRMASKQQSALITHLQRQTGKQVPLDEKRQEIQFIMFKQKINDLKLKKSNTNRKTVHNIKSSKMLEKYASPIFINKQNRLKRYIFNSYATQKNSPNK